MLRFRLALAVLLSLLWACGGEDPPPDHRPNVTGTYEVTGTARFVEGGEETTGPMQDTLNIVKDDSSLMEGRGVRLHLEALKCGALALMDGEQSFIVQDSPPCSLPSSDDCAITLTFREGTGRKLANGDLQASLRARLDATCPGGGRGVAAYYLEMTGEGTGQSLPGQHEQALTDTAPAGLAEAVERLTRTLQP